MAGMGQLMKHAMVLAELQWRQGVGKQLTRLERQLATERASRKKADYAILERIQGPHPAVAGNGAAALPAPGAPAATAEAPPVESMAPPPTATASPGVGAGEATVLPNLEKPLDGEGRKTMELLAERVYERIRRRLSRDLLLQRDRAGRLSDSR
jgi:hypothetical protein